MNGDIAGREKDLDQKGRNDRAAAAILFKYRYRQRIIRSLEIVLRLVSQRWSTATPCALDEVKSILVFEAANLGDIVLFAPFLRSLRMRFPKAHIAFLGKSTVEAFLLEQGLADELIPIRAPWAEHRSRWKRYNPFSTLWPQFLRCLIQLRARRFDLAFASGRSDIRANFAIWLSGARRRVGYGFGGGSFLLTDVAAPDLAHPHTTDLSLRFLEHLGIAVRGNGKLLRISPEEESFATRFLAERGISGDRPLVGIHPGARIKLRQWGENNFQEIGRQIQGKFGAVILWFSDPSQPSSLSSKSSFVPVSLPLQQFLAVLSKCHLLVCNDSGPMHLAGGLGIPVVAVFGPTQPEWFGPLGNNHKIVIRRDMWCRPCGDQCLFDEPYCLRTIPVEQVMKAVTEQIKGSPFAKALVV